MPPTSRHPSASSASPPAKSRDIRIDVLRGLTITWVVAYHVYADTRGVPGADVATGFLGALAHGQIGTALAEIGKLLVGLPSVRLDLFLLVTGLTLALRPDRSLRAYARRRARTVLPNYWLGSLLFVAALIALAALRAALTGQPLAEEIRGGTVLALEPYRFEALDLPTSLSVLGRFRDERSMQVVAPSMWYVVLVLQAYLAFPLLRSLHARLGSARFLALSVVFTCCARAVLLAHAPLAGFSAEGLLAYMLPARIAPVALGVVIGTHHRRWSDALRAPPAGWTVLPSVACLVAVTVLAQGSIHPGARGVVLGPIAPLILALPAVAVLTSLASARPRLAALLAFTGQRTLSVLVVQDLLRVAIGTAVSLGVDLRPWTWLLLPAVLAATLALARLWHPLAVAVALRTWPDPPSRRPLAGAAAHT